MADLLGNDDGPEQTQPRCGGEYVVVARRYRPQSFDELIGQEHVAKGLAAAIAASRVGHAYLFTGSRGTGKTSTARIFAKALNCIHGPTPAPCNQCDICSSITAGDDMDVLEIDGASNRGIDEIRQLRQNVNVRPSRARFKIYIIDEVHMLTKEAFNALLKTLEEPPEHVKFIFCTTEPEKIPITILSRCQRYDFAGIQTSQIVERLRHIATAEKVDAEPEALEILARRAAGSMRDSQSLLEQLLAFGSNRITVSDVHKLLGTAGSERIGRIVSALVERNATAALAETDKAAAEGVDVGQLLDQLLGYFRDVMAAAVGVPAESLLHVTTAEQPAVREAATRLGLHSILAILQIIDQALARMRYINYPRIIAELALVRICQLEDLDALPALVAELRDGSGVVQHSAGAAPSAPKVPSQVSPSAATSAKKKYEAPEVNASEQSGTVSLPARTIKNGKAAEQTLSPPQVTDNGAPELAAPITELTAAAALAAWQSAAESIGGLAGQMAQHASTVLVSPESAIDVPHKLVVQFPGKYNSSKVFCERPEIAARFAKAMAPAIGGQVRLGFETVDGGDSSQAAARPVSTRQRMAQVCQQSFVRHAMETFKATPERLEEPSEI